MKRVAVPLLCALATLGVPAGELRYVTSWIGNSFGNADGRYVGNNVHAMFTAPDGTCYTNTPWEEGTREAGIYRNGDVIGKLPDTHGWGVSGGYAVTASDRYVFLGLKADSESGALRGPAFPPKGAAWYGVRRYFLDGRHAPFTGGKGRFGDHLVLHVAPEKADADVRGLAVDRGGRLFVSDAYENQVRVYDAERMTPLHEWSLARPRQMAMGSTGSLWVTQAADTSNPARATRFISIPPWRPLQITFSREAVPRGLAFDSQGRLLVTDVGPDQNVKVYDVLSARPRLLGTFGTKGGTYGGTRGQVGPLRFNMPVGIGVDRAGNRYVCSAGSVFGGGTALESYAPGGKRNWALFGLEFVDNADADPLADADVYTKEEHFVMDYLKPPGQEWSYRGCTVDRFRYPQDPRLHLTSHISSTWVRRIRGRRFLAVTDMYADALQLFRFDLRDGEVAVPAGLFAKAHKKEGAWPPDQPLKGEWIWRDANGDGTFEGAEYDSRASDAPGLWGWWVDERGDVWQATEKEGIRHFPLQGLDSHGNPIYTYAAMKTNPVPAPFNNLQRLEYVPATDTMYLGGYTPRQPLEGGMWKIVGRVIARYDHWNQGNREPRWQIVLPWDVTASARYSHASMVRTVTAAMSVEGEYVFTVLAREGTVDVYRADTGARVGSLSPGPEVGRKTGWIDIPYGIRARRRPTGEYLIFVEEDAYGKVIMYRWTPHS
jgi:hypothetical protein